MSLIRLLDVSGIFWPIWRKKEAMGRPVGEAASETVQALRERAAASDVNHVVACCDSGRSFRWQIAEEYRATKPDYAGYKGHRAEKDPAMMAALDRVIDELDQDGVPILRAAGFEADDVIATVTKWAHMAGHDVEIVSEDKDLLQLARDCDPNGGEQPSVVVVRRDGTRQGEEDCVRRIGVPPSLVAPFLALAGDTSDGVIGVPGVASTWATRLLWGEYDDAKQWQPTRFKSFDAIVSAAVEEQASVEQIEREKLRRRVETGKKKGASDQTIADRLKITLDEVANLAVAPPLEFSADFKPFFHENVRKSLITNADNYDIGLRLTTLRDDVPLDFDMVTAPRVPKPKDTGFQVDGYEEREDDMQNEQTTPAAQTTEAAAPSSHIPSVTAETVEPSQARAVAPVSQAAPMVLQVAPPPRAEMAVREIQQVTEQALAPRGGAYSLNLDPRDFKEARMLAKDIHDAKIFPKIQSPQQALAFIMTGREYGLPAMASCRLIHNIDGQMAVHAQVKIGLAMKSRRVEYMYIKEWVDDGENSFCVWVGKRRDRTKEDTCRYGFADAKRQLLVKDKGNWAKIPGWMSMVRSGANMATILIPDEMAGLYTFDEMGAAEPMLSVDPRAA